MAGYRLGLAKCGSSAASPGVLEAEVRRATAAGALEFSDWGYEIPSGGLTPAPRTGAPGGDVEVWNAQVLLRYALDGVDALPTRKAVYMTLAKRGAQGAVARKRVGEGKGVAVRLDLGGGGSINKKKKQK